MFICLQIILGTYFDELRVDDSAIPFAHVVISALLIRGLYFNLEVIELRSGDGPGG